MKYKKDDNLTEYQQRLSWSVYCELDMENNEDIKAVLQSLSKLVEEVNSN